MLKKNNIIFMMFFMASIARNINTMQKVDMIDLSLKAIINKRYPGFDNKDINKQDKYGNTILDFALYNNDKEMVSLLLKHKDVNINAVDKYRNTALMKAAAYGRTDIVKLFIDNGVDINVKNNDGYTTLDIAANHGHKDIVQLLEAVKNKNNQKSTCLVS